MEYTYTQLEDFIKQLYKRLSISDPIEINMMEIADNLNIKLHFYDDGSTAICRKSVFHIFINERLTVQEKWQDFGHELCHVLRHEGSQNGMVKPFLYLQENQAENFMYYFCVPTFMLLNFKISSFLDVKAGIPFVVQNFNVTETFAEERLKRFKRQLLQSKSDAEHRAYMEALYPKSPPYSYETNAILKRLNMLLEKKGVRS
ncbi:MAG: Phage-like element protein xkdA [Bacillales bacterium]|jgi:Zn-dependent peptidase ImmA (M78 family)|nr:Phage-like element protein xkdA [Bacillales bacterium]